METWLQNYTAVGGSLYMTAAMALLPIVFFFVALTAVSYTHLTLPTTERV